MKIDDSFKKPGAVPFKWEIRPGVPKLQNPDDRHFESEPEKLQQRKHHLQQKQKNPSPETPPKFLKPPPAGFYFQPPMELRTHSFRSSPRTFSHRFGMPVLARSDVVSSAGCFPSPLAKRKNVKKKRTSGAPRCGTEPEYYSDLEIPSRWSVSSRKSVSPLSSSLASYQSSPRPVSDAEWAAFGLF